MRLVIFGTGGHAKSVIEAIHAEGSHTIVGLVSEDGKKTHVLPGVEVIASNANAIETSVRLGAEGAIVALGDSLIRKKIVEHIHGELKFPVIVHPAAWVSPSATLGGGTVVCAGAVVGASTVLGRHCIVNTRASVDHDCTVGDFVHICPGVTVAGYVTIGSNVWVGVGSTVVDRVRIADNAFMKAHSLVAEPRMI